MADAIDKALAGTPRSWLDYTHPHYAQHISRWRLVQDFYLGNLADETCARGYLIRRFQGEPDQAYGERLKTSDYTPHLGTLVDSIVGMGYAVEERATRVWRTDENQGLGDPDEEGSLAHRLIRDSNGRGVSWKTMVRQVGLDLVNYQCLWGLVDTVDGMPVVKVIPPTIVPNWRDGTNGPVEVLMEEMEDYRATLEDDPRAAKTWIRWTLTGWERYRKSEQGDPVLLDSGTYSYVDRQNRATLPIFRVELPMRRYVAWVLAKKAQVLFNQESVRDFGLRIANFSKLVIGVSDDTQLENMLLKIQKGENVLPEIGDAKGTHRYIAPDAGPTQNASEVLKQKVEDFWRSGFKMYEDSAQERTATEVKQDVAAGIGAFLQLWASAVDDFENQAMWRLGQAEFAESPERWGAAHVERSDDFSSVDSQAVVDMMRKRYLGEQETIPIGRSAVLQLAKESATYDGLDANDGEIEAAYDMQQVSRFALQMESLPIPPLVKARLAMRFVANLGLVKADEVAANAEGESVSLLKLLTADAEEIAMAKAEAEKRMAELPAFNPAPDDGEDTPLPVAA
jgi:hypothetical protein